MKKLLILFFFICLTLIKPTQAATANHIVISEIQISGATGFSTDEFVELFNPLESAVDITGWQLIKRTVSGAAYPLIEQFESAQIPAHGYYLIAHPTGYKGSIIPDAHYSTNNSISSDNSLELVNSQGIVDLVGWGKASHFENTVASTPGSSKSLERKALAGSTAETMQADGSDIFRGNGEDSGNNSSDFIIRDLPEPQNVSSELEFVTAPAPTTPVPSQPTTPPVNLNTNQTISPVILTPVSPRTLNITEVLPDPKGADLLGEFIEIFNYGEETVDLAGLKLADASKSNYIFLSMKLEPGKYYAVKRADSGIALNNTGGETVNLTAPDGTVVSTLQYKETAPEGQAYALINKEWKWTKQPTPGQANIYLDPNQAPIAKIKDIETDWWVKDEIELSATPSSDPDGDDLEFTWRISDGRVLAGTKIKLRFIKAGKIEVNLEAKDTKGKSGLAKKVFNVKDFQRSKDMVISALMPNPGEGAEEWLELKNLGSVQVDLTGWILQSKKKQTKLETIIKPKSSLQFTSEDLNFALNNTGGEIVLIDPDGKTISSASYSKAKPGEIFSRNQQGVLVSDQSLVSEIKSSNNIANTNGKVAGATTNESTFTNQPVNISNTGKTNQTLPIWSWAVIGGGLCIAWLIWEMFRRR